MQQMIVYVLRLRDKGVRVADELNELFAGELNPVAVKAQSKVPLPDGSAQCCLYTHTSSVSWAAQQQYGSADSYSSQEAVQRIRQVAPVHTPSVNDSSVPTSPHAKWHLDPLVCFCSAHNAYSVYFAMGRKMSSKIALPT